MFALIVERNVERNVTEYYYQLCVCVCSSSGIQKRLEMIRSDVCFKPVTSVLFTAVRCPVYRCPTLKPGILKKQKIYLQINIDCKENHHHHHCAFHHLNLVTEADSLLCYCVQMYLWSSYQSRSNDFWKYNKRSNKSSGFLFHIAAFLSVKTLQKLTQCVSMCMCCAWLNCSMFEWTSAHSAKT